MVDHDRMSYADTEAFTMDSSNPYTLSSLPALLSGDISAWERAGRIHVDVVDQPSTQTPTELAHARITGILATVNDLITERGLDRTGPNATMDP